MFGHNNFDFSIRTFNTEELFWGKPLLNRANDETFTEIGYVGFLTNAPLDADYTQIPHIKMNVFGNVALVYPSGLSSSDLGSGTQAEKIARAKEMALKDNEAWGPYWVDELTTFGCADPEAENYCEDCEYHVGSYACGYGCDDENRNTDFLGNCLTSCKDGFEFVTASKAKGPKCVAIEKSEKSEKSKETITLSNTSQDDDNTWMLLGGVGVVCVAGFFALRK
jgi:hypothetical protein